VPVLTTVEAAATSAATSPTARLSGLLGLGTVATHVAVLTAVEAATAATAAASAAALLGLCALAAHVAVLPAVEAAAAATAAATTAFSAATLLAPANADGPATDAVAVELRNGLLRISLIVEVHEGEGTLYIYEWRSVTYLYPDLTGPDVGEESFELPRVYVVGDIPDKQAHVVKIYIFIIFK